MNRHNIKVNLPCLSIIRAQLMSSRSPLPVTNTDHYMLKSYANLMGKTSEKNTCDF